MIGTDSEKSYFILPFEGWRKNHLFVWKIRPELVQAIKELKLFDKNETFNDDNEYYVSRLEGIVLIEILRLNYMGQNVKYVDLILKRFMVKEEEDIYRRRDYVPTPDELKEEIQKNKR